MTKVQNIILVGFMGTGKTTVGRIVAERRGMSFVDMDDLIEEREAKSIDSIFAEDGEAHFRALERQLVKELAQSQGLVIGAGGGVVLNPDNIGDYEATGLVVCLTAPPDVILERVAKDSHRPLLEGGEKAQKIIGMLESRKALYGAIPFQVDTTKLTPDQVADEIVARLLA
jgi:shikimate kinase